MDDQTVLEQFVREVGELRVHRSALGEAKKKPLLLLLVVSMIRRGELRENVIRFTEVEHRLSDLIIRYGARPTDSGPKPEQPFYHLRTSPFWELTIPGGLPTGSKKTISKKLLSAPGAFAQLRPAVFELIYSGDVARDAIVDIIMRRWWAADEAKALRSDLGLI